jgi:hypothetical protein
MTLISYSGLVSDNRGKLNGSIFSKCHAGNVIKNFCRPQNPRSATQQPNRANWQFLLFNWQTLSDIQRQTWHRLAKATTWSNKLGQQFHPTGQQLFLYCNQNLFTINQLPLTSAVTPTGFEHITSASITEQLLGSYAMFLNFSPHPCSPRCYYKVYATRSLSPGISYAKKYLKLIGIFDHSEDSPIDITSLYLSFFTQPITGKKIFYKIVPVEIASGFDSIPLYFNHIAGSYNPNPIIVPVQFGFSF